MGRFRFTRIRLNLAPRLHTGDCFDIHNLHEKLCDQLLSNHQTFLLEVLDYQCVFCSSFVLRYFVFIRTE